MKEMRKNQHIRSIDSHHLSHKVLAMLAYIQHDDMYSSSTITLPSLSTLRLVESSEKEVELEYISK